MSDLIITLGFISIFHFIGGVAVGSTLRDLRNGFPFRKAFFLIWGLLFGCMPLALGAQTFLKAGVAHLFAVELIVLVGAIIGAAFIPDWVLESYNPAICYPLDLADYFSWLA